jgi:sugar lactone lactonase YvrE
LKIRGVLLFLVVFCSVLASPAVAATSGPVVPGAQQAAPRVTANPFGIRFPASRDPQQWRAWQEHVRAQLEARSNTHVRANASGASGNGIIETIAGAAPFQQPVNALKTGFGNEIEALTEDSAGNLYVASCDLGVVLKIDPSSNTTVYAGKPLPVGPAIAAGDGGTASSARIGCPAGLALDSSNNLYISDAFSATVREVDAATGIIQTIAGTTGNFGHAGDGGPGTSALLTYPTGLALDGQGNLFIEDQGYLWRLNLTTGVIQTFAGSGFIPNPCSPSATALCPALQTNFYFQGPTIVAHGGYLYSAPAYIFDNQGRFDPSIVSINLSSGSVQLLAGGGTPAGTPTSTYPAVGLILNAQSLAVDGAGNLFFSGQYQASNGGAQPNLQPEVDGIFELSASDNSVRGVAGTNTPSNTTGDGGPATSAEIALAGAMCLTPKGGVVFSDGSFNIRTFPIGGNLSTIAGDGWPNFFGDNGPAQQAGLTNPSGVATDAQGNVYVADWGNERVRKIDAATGVITTVAGGVTPQNADAELSPALQPFAVALDGNNHLYGRSEGAIEAIDLNTGAISTLVPHVSAIGPIAFDGNRTLYYSSVLNYGSGSLQNNGVWTLDVTTGATTQIAGGNAHAGEPSGDGGPALQAGLSDVEGLALDGQGNLYLADSGFEDIRTIDLSTGIISTVAGVPGIVSPFGYSGDGDPATSATFNGPAGLAYDAAGHLTIVDSRNYVLRQIDLATNIVTTVVGNHTPGFGGDGGSPTAAMLYGLNAIAYDPGGNLVIADSKNYRVRRVVLHPTKLNATLTYAGASSGDVTFSATYSGLSFGFAPTGTVTFLNGSTSLGTRTVAAATDGSGNFVATLTATSVPGNGATLTAQYSGDTNYAALTTTTAFQPPTPSYTISAKPASLTVKQGASGSVTFTVTPQNGFTQAVSFQCDNSTLPKGVACSFSPASVTPNGTAAVTSTLTIATTGATATALYRPTHGFGWLPGGAVLALLLFGIPGAPRRFWSGVLMLVVLSIGCGITIGGGIIGCGGGGSGSTGGGSHAANATPPGAYSIQVTTSAGSATDTSPVTVSLTVTQ